MTPAIGFEFASPTFLVVSGDTNELSVYRSALVRDDHDLYASTAQFIAEHGLSLHEETAVEDPDMMMGRATLSLYRS